MHRTLLLLLAGLSLFSCKKSNNLPSVETITSGSKWGIRIGSSPEAVYSQLQALDKEKNFQQVAMVFRPPYAKPQDLHSDLSLYSSVTLMNNTAVIEGVLFEFRGDKVYSISAGGALPDEITQWPSGAPDAATIHVDDPVSGIYSKLLAIYQLPGYSNYQIILPDKPLDKAFDPDMATYGEWAFSIATVVSSEVRGLYTVRLYFEGGQLTKIWYQYNEGVVYN